MNQNIALSFLIALIPLLTTGCSEFHKTEYGTSPDEEIRDSDCVIVKKEFIHTSPKHYETKIETNKDTLCKIIPSNLDPFCGRNDNSDEVFVRAYSTRDHSEKPNGYAELLLGGPLQIRDKDRPITENRLLEKTVSMALKKDSKIVVKITRSSEEPNFDMPAMEFYLAKVITINNTPKRGALSNTPFFTIPSQKPGEVGDEYHPKVIELDINKLPLTDEHHSIIQSADFYLIPFVNFSVGTSDPMFSGDYFISVEQTFEITLCRDISA